MSPAAPKAKAKSRRKRRWLRRITYLLAAGVGITGAGLWTLRQPFVSRWLITELDARIREETGLAFQAKSLDLRPFRGQVVLRGLSLGEDLLQADRLTVQVDFSSLLGRDWHIWNIELENPASVLDAKRLERIRLKPRPPQGAAPRVRLDRLSIVGGRVQIQEPAWGLPRAEFTYGIQGRGLGPNRLGLDIEVPRFQAAAGSGALDGNLRARLDLSDLAVDLKTGEVVSGRNHIALRGGYAFEQRMLGLRMEGRLDLAESVKLLAPDIARRLEGTARFEAGIQGRATDPTWTLAVHGRDLVVRSKGLEPGSLELAAHGDLRKAVLQKLEWHSSQGELEAQGEWKRGTGSHVQFLGRQFGLAPFAVWARVPYLKAVSLDLEGEAELPGDPWDPFRVEQVQVRAEGRFLREGAAAGGVTAGLSRGRLEVRHLALQLPEVRLEGSGEFGVGRGGLQSAACRATAEIDAARVAEVLRNWGIGEGRDPAGAVIQLGMAGRTKATADVAWDRAGGARLTGEVEVEAPRWHGASLDRLRADVSIQDEELRIENVVGEKGTGRADGHLWLTWAEFPPGQDRIDMRFEAQDLPIEEGLKAGDVGELPISGMGSGWARIHGPYDRLRVEAGGSARDGRVYGLTIPCAAGEMVYDIADGRMTVRDIRVAERPEALEENASGLLALRGDLDLERESWTTNLQGSVDSGVLGLPGPRFQANVEARFEGPWVRDFGPLSLPVGTLTFRNGRVFLDQQSLEGFEGSLETSTGIFRASLGMAGKGTPLATLEARAEGQGLGGDLRIHLAPDSADTAHLAGRLTKDLLLDGGLDFRARTLWDASGFHWQGTLENLVARFEGFGLVQERPATLKGDTAGLGLELDLTGIDPGLAQQPSARVGISGTLPFSGSVPLDVRLAGEAELANLKHILDRVLEADDYSLLADLKPGGSARFDLKLGGPYSFPTLDGLLSLRNGRLSIRTYPQSVEDLSFDLHFKGREMILLESDPLRGRVAQGSFRASGVATWEIGELATYDLKTHLEDFQLRDLPEGFELYGTLDAVLQGTKEEGGILSGTLQSRHMLYQADINLRDIILASAMGGSPALLGADPNDPLARIDLDLDLVLSQPWEFDTNLLKLQGRPAGTFKILGNLAEPGFKGKMDILPGGRLTNLLPAGDVVLERSSLEWANPRVWYPKVDLQGRVDVPPYVINLTIRGGLDGLEMRQSATPALRQDEITAILIDPSLASDIGSLSGPNAQTAINSGLASTGSGLVTTLALANFQESLRRTFKLDRVSVAWRMRGTASETSVTVGKNIDLFGHRTPVVVTHQKSGTTATTSGQVEWRFGNFVLQLGVSQSGDNGAAPSGEIRHTWSPGW